MVKRKKIGVVIALVVIVALAVFIYVRFFFVFGEGAKTGELNYVVKKGYIFKTYEGKMIQAGFKTDSSKGILSNEFLFSISDTDLAESMMTQYEGKTITLHYKEYFGKLPWRGYSKFIVDKVTVSENAGSTGINKPTEIPIQIE